MIKIIVATKNLLLKICLTFLTANLLTFPIAQAQTKVNTTLPLETNIEENRENPNPEPELINPASELFPNLSESETIDPLAQITNVNQLRDVSPGDWAFEALRNLIDNYGCLQGYPDGTYRGSRTISRYEFAAGLNSCLQEIETLLRSETNNNFAEIDREILTNLQRLRQEFASELAILRGEIDGIQARTRELELTQFSTTTQLTGNVFFNVTGAFADDKIKAEGLDAFRAQRTASRPFVREVEDAEVTFSYLTWLNLNTSFTGRDLLVTQLAVGNGVSPVNEFASAGLFNTFGSPYTDQTAGVESNDVIIRELFYRFPVTSNLQAVVGPRINWYRYFDDNRFTSIFNGASSFNSSGSTLLNTSDRGSGLVLIWNPGEILSFRVGYLGESTEFLPDSLFNTASNPKEGLFGGTNTLTTELTYSPSDRLNLRFLYNRSNLQNINGQVGGALAEPLTGFADDSQGGAINDATADTFSFNFDWLITDKLGIFGRYGYAITNIYPQNSNLDNGEINTQSLQLGLAFPDLGKEGALATLSYLIPFSILDGREFLVSGGGNGGVQYEFELTYYYPLTDNIALVPAFYFIGNANNFSDNPNIYIGNFRAQFSF
ncbi:MAG: iron uptake porin [Oscillatoria sp. PMC 1068.18]|nr:iron uptake porin [Oscillatoria sp. PMC 1076.18]MEC4988933.1 iron uptake porin [Oscillatoria sp. PMC 1068.18]